MKNIKKIVLTGGPCGGKTSAISRISDELTQRGWYVLVIPETATELIPNGIKCCEDCLSSIQFQSCVIKKQIEKEKMYYEVAEMIPHDKVVIICDRGIMDSKSYVTDKEFNTILKNLKLKQHSIMGSYDMVIHLVTAAKGAEKYYTLSNNPARSESVEEAIAVDEKTLKNWVGHENLKIVSNDKISSFEEKLDKVMECVYTVIGQPIPIDIQYKYLVRIPDLVEIEKLGSCKVEIFQAYYDIPYFDERKIKVVTKGDTRNYYLTDKKWKDRFCLKRAERITENQCHTIMLEKGGFDKHQTLKKKRIFFEYKGQYFNLDLYDFAEDRAILEIHLTNVSCGVEIPDFIKVIENVTSNEQYKNRRLAKTHLL